MIVPRSCFSPTVPTLGTWAFQHWNLLLPYRATLWLDLTATFFKEGFNCFMSLMGGKGRCLFELMSSGASSSYVGPSSVSDIINLQVFCLNGEGYVLELSGCSTGWKVYEMVSKQLPRKKGTLTPSWCSTCHCKSTEFQARKQAFPALVFQQMFMQHGVLYKSNHPRPPMHALLSKGLRK